MSEIREHDIVRVTQDLPELGLAKGATATVLLVYTSPRLAYEIEQMGEDCETLFLGAVEPQFLERVSDGYGNP